MNKRSVLYIVAGVILAIALIWYFYEPKSKKKDIKRIPATWTPHLKQNSRDPYGTWMFFELLKNSTYKFSTVEGNPSDNLEEYSENPDAALLVAYANTYPDYIFVWEKMETFIENGNYALFILNEDPSNLKQYYNGALQVLTKADSLVKLRFPDKRNKLYEFDLQDDFKRILNTWNYFALEDSVKIVSDESTSQKNDYWAIGDDFEFLFIVHEENEFGKPVYIEIPFGDGAIFIHRTPLAFTNIALLDEKNVEHAEKVLSKIPYENIIYNTAPTAKKPKKVKARVSPLQFILSDPSLSWAYYLSLGGLLLFALFNLKRRQRAIPILPSKANSTLEFADALSKIYFQKHNNQNLVKHKYRIFTTFIRTHYQILPMKDHAEYARIISVKSGVDKNLVEDILKAFEKHTSSSVKDEQLIELHKKLDNFYKNCK